MASTNRFLNRMYLDIPKTPSLIFLRLNVPSLDTLLFLHSLKIHATPVTGEGGGGGDDSLLDIRDTRRHGLCLWLSVR